MCHGGLLTSEAVMGCSRTFKVFRLKFCLDPTGGGVTLQGLGHMRLGR